MLVYISHCSKDSEVAAAIAAELLREGHEVFPEDDFAAGSNWAMEIARNLARASAMVVLVSPASMKSAYVRKDIEFALGAEQFKDRLIPVILRRSNDVPWILNEIASIEPPAHASPQKIAGMVSRAIKRAPKVTEKAKA
jgi:hypothetical protein